MDKKKEDCHHHHFFFFFGIQFIVPSRSRLIKAHQVKRCRILRMKNNNRDNRFFSAVSPLTTVTFERS
jgi:hypothetical protein